MPNIKSSTDLRNNYNGISSYCRETGEPVYITKNGRGDLAVMNIDSFNKLMDRYELYRLLEQSEFDFTSGNTMDFNESIEKLRAEIKNGSL